MIKNNKAKLLSVIFAFVFSFAILPSQAFATTFGYDGSSSIKVGESLVLNLIDGPPNMIAHIVFTSPGGGKFSSDIKTNAQGNASYKFTPTTPNEAGSWKAVLTMGDPVLYSGSTSWTVLAGDPVAAPPPARGGLGAMCADDSGCTVKYSCDVKEKRCLVPIGRSCDVSNDCVSEAVACENSFCVEKAGDSAKYMTSASPANGGNNNVLLQDGELCFGNNEICEHNFCGDDGKCQTQCQPPAVWNSIGNACWVPNNNGPAGGPGNGGNGGTPSADGKLVCNNGICLPADQQQCRPNSIVGACNVTDLLVTILKLLLGLAGVVAVLILIVGGFWYITSSGNEEQAEKGKKAIINAVLGLIVIILSYAIVTIINNTLTARNL
ncbi:MAG TPA: pilin [Candidatus Limnocylindria bacterium]|nr:pilin [Candidatus Limnocylindria bacterium]